MKFVQESLNNNAKALFSEQKFHKIFQSEANNFFENQSKEISNIANCYFYDPQSLESNYITKTQISDILYEYSKAPELRNYKYLDEITVKNYFFSRFPQEIRLKLLKISAPIEYNSGDIIFHEGEIGDDMYAIIRGSIVITKKSNIYKDQEIPIASLYDGRYFGELSLVPKEINESQGVRSVTCTASEQTLVFALSKIEYNHILLEQLEHDLDKKIMFLSQLDFFKNIDPYILIPLATNIETFVFENSQEILEKGQLPLGLYIIVKGFAVAVTEGIRIKSKNNSKDSVYKSIPLKNFKEDIAIESPNLAYKNNLTKSERKINNYIMSTTSNT